MSFISNQLLDFDFFAGSPINTQNNKIRVAIITDVVNWAYSNIAFNLMNVSQDKIDFIVIPASDPLSFKDNMLHVLLAAQHCHVLHFMWRGFLFWFLNDVHARLEDMCDMQTIKANLINNKIISTCVYDHSHLPNESYDVYQSFRTQIKKNYYVSSNRLFNIYSDIEGIDKPRSVCTDGVDLKLFKPKNPFRYDLTNLDNRMITIGWAGNSDWGGQGDDHKGLHAIIKPTIERLALEGYPIRLEIADRKIIWRDQHDMPDFYNSIDIYACASFHEGTPNTILEAMACGVIIITTDVGVVREALGPMQQEYIVDRDLNNFYYKMKHLLDNLPIWKTLSFENLQYIRPWDWTVKAQKLIDYFTLIVEESDLCQQAHASL